MPEGNGKTDAELRKDALAVLTGNRHGTYTVPAIGLYPYQWCWDTGPIVLGWASVGEWDQAWGELDKLFSAQWPSGMVPHIVFWEQSDDYFPGPEVWSTGREPRDDGPHPAAAPRERGRTTVHRRSRSRPRARADRSAVAAPRRVAGVDRTRPHRAAPRRGRRPSVGVGHGQLARVGRAARGHAGDLERAPRATRRRDGVGEAAPVDEGVPALPRHRRRAPQGGMEHRDARWPTARSRSRTRRSPRSWAAPLPISPPSPTRPGRTGAT